MPKLTLSFKGRELSIHPLGSGSTLIGSDPQCLLHIDSLAVAPRHAEIVVEQDKCRIIALDAEWPVWINSAAVNSAELSPGDLLGIGKHTLRYSAEELPLAGTAEIPDETTGPAPTEQNRERPRAYLQILSGEHIGRIIPINRNMMRLGKAGGDCAIVVHRNNHYYLSFLEGHAPVVNGVIIGEESVALDTGSTIRIGDTELQFYY